ALDTLTCQLPDSHQCPPQVLDRPRGRGHTRRGSWVCDACVTLRPYTSVLEVTHSIGRHAPVSCLVQACPPRWARRQYGMTNQSEGATWGGRAGKRVEQRPRPDHQDAQMERGRAQEADPHASERLFWATFDRAVVGIAHQAPDGRLLRFNQRLCDLLG